MSLLHKFDTSVFCDFDPDSYSLFFQHFDQKVEQLFGLAISEKTYWDVLARLPEEWLLASIPVGKLNKLRLSQFLPNLNTSALLGIPDLHGNTREAGQVGLVLPGRLWQAVGKSGTLDWVAELLGLQVTYYDPPQTALWDYGRPIGRTYCHLDGDHDLITWVQHWVEPNSRPIGNPSLSGGYQLGSLFRPILGANLVSIRFRTSGDGILSEVSTNKAAFDRRTLPLVEPELAQDVGFNVRSVEERKAPASKLELLPKRQLIAEGSGLNTVGFSVDKLDVDEPIEVPNKVRFSDKTVTMYNEFQ